MNQSTGVGPVTIDPQVDDCPREADNRVEVYEGGALLRSVYACALHTAEVERGALADGGETSRHPMTSAVDRPVCGSTYTYEAIGHTMALFDVQGGWA